MTKKHIDKTCCFFRTIKKRCKRKNSGPASRQACPLSETCYHGKVKVCAVNGDRKNCAKMAHLGLLPGQEIELLCKNKSNQCLVKVNGGTLSLDNLTADNIIVAPV